MEKQITKKNTARQNRTFRLSEYELHKLSEDAKAVGMNESKYLRELIVHGGVDVTHAEDRRNLIRHISGIATNINQMAKHCNESKWFGNVASHLKHSLAYICNEAKTEKGSLVGSINCLLYSAATMDKPYSSHSLFVMGCIPFFQSPFL